MNANTPTTQKTINGFSHLIQTLEGGALHADLSPPQPCINNGEKHDRKA